MNENFLHFLFMMKQLHPRTEDEDDNGGSDHQNNAEISRKKKAKMKRNNSETDYSSFVALVTALNLQKDVLYLPQDFTTSNGFNTECSEIILKDEKEETSWTLNLRFNKSYETFYVNRGWGCFCNDNGRKAGGLFVFNLVGNGEIPVLSFRSAESDNNCSEVSEKVCRDSTTLSKSQNQHVTLTITPYGVRHGKLQFPMRFTRENDMSKFEMITLLGNDGIKQQAELLFDKANGAMSLGKGWKYFLQVNGLKTGDSFKLELIWENATPMLRLCHVEKKGSLNRFVTLTLTYDSLRKSRLHLPLAFVRDNGITKPGKITLLGKDGTKWLVHLLLDRRRKMNLGKGLRDFLKANDLKIGESFTLEVIWENETPMLRLFFSTAEFTRSDRRMEQGECSKASEKKSVSTKPSSGNKTRTAKNNREERRDDSSSTIPNRFATFTLTAEDATCGTLDLPSGFMKENNINKLGKITMLGNRGTKWFGYLLRKDGLVALGCEWKSFCEDNGVEIGESFTLEFIYEQNAHLIFKFWSKCPSVQLKMS